MTATVTGTRIGYRSPGGGELPLLLFTSAEERPSAVLLLFHGGGRQQGDPEQFAPQARRLAAEGALVVSAGYRLIGQGARGRPTASPTLRPRPRRSADSQRPGGSARRRSSSAGDRRVGSSRW